jgi:hypothetical protein
MSDDEYDGDEYRDLLIAAKDALGELLRASEPGTGPTLHTAYADLKDSITRREDLLNGRDKPETHDTRDQAEEWWKRRQTWRRTPDHERRRIALDALGDERLSVREVQERINATHEVLISDSNVQMLFTRMLQAGEIDREVVDGRARQKRYRYFRKPMSGEIVALEKLLEQTETGGDA